MARRILNRRELREQADHAAAVVPAATESAPAATTPEKKKKAPAAPRVRKPRAPKAPPRMRARWGIFDAGMKQVAVFDYNQRAAADEKLADLLSRKKGIHFVQMVKEPMPEPEPALAPAVS